MKDPNKEAMIEGSGSSTLDKEAIAEGSSGVEEKGVIEEGSSSASPSALPRASDGQLVIQTASVNVSIPPRAVEETSEEVSKSYSCRFCSKKFSTAQALGGHQNSHREERAFAKRQKRFKNLTSNFNCSSLSYPNYGQFSNSLSIERPQFSSYNSNNFTLPKTPLIAYPSYSSTPGVSNPRSTTGYPSGQSNNPSSGMLPNNIQLAVSERPRMTSPYTGTYGNYNYLSGGEGSMLGGSRAAASKSSSMGSDLTLGLGTLNENRRFLGDGFEAGGGSSSGMSRNLFELSLRLGTNVSREIQDTARGHDESDCTVDLLSRVGMGSGEDEETNGDRGKGKN